MHQEVPVVDKLQVFLLRVVDYLLLWLNRLEDFQIIELVGVVLPLRGDGVVLL